MFRFFGRSIKFFRIHWVVLVRYGDRSGLIQQFQVVCMSVRMFHVVFGQKALVLHVVSQNFEAVLC